MRPLENQFRDEAKREGLKISVCPWNPSVAALTDTTGRVRTGRGSLRKFRGIFFFLPHLMTSNSGSPWVCLYEHDVFVGREREKDWPAVYVHLPPSSTTFNALISVVSTQGGGLTRGGFIHGILDTPPVSMYLRFYMYSLYLST